MHTEQTCFGSFKNERKYSERVEAWDEMISMVFECIEVFYNRKTVVLDAGQQVTDAVLE